MRNIALILSVLVGIIVVYGIKPSAKIVHFLLAFSGAYLLSITALHLLPEVYSHEIHAHTSNYNIGIFIVLGLLLQIILDFFSKGAEHGHIHIHDKGKIPWLLIISLCIHAYMEGIPLAHNHGHNTLLWAIVIHKIPVTIILGTFLIQAKFNKSFSLLFLIMFAFMSPLGNLSGEYIPLFVTYKTQITALIIGIFLHISTTILFESSENHKFNSYKFISILVGVAVALLA
ncbi:ZIP family metal transporter [Aureivirga sp. CE67]|uniref:ZIP family metal transporter n=1 Tax=Aureivirga sp. CE67 TaxID=1788983 RepID=UPI0018CAC3BD|nr:ZIP family metal transporter [Aureivirga sp. CE67]